MPVLHMIARTRERRAHDKKSAPANRLKTANQSPSLLFLPKGRNVLWLPLVRLCPARIESKLLINHLRYCSPKEEMIFGFLWFVCVLACADANVSNSSDIHEHERQHLKSKFLELFRNVILNKQYNDHNAINDGRDWPPEAKAFSMAGMRRIDHFSAIVAQAITFGVPGHVIETGVWRGGASFMAAKTIELLNQKHNMLTYLCDSFKGIPKTDKKCEILSLLMTAHCFPPHPPISLTLSPLVVFRFIGSNWSYHVYFERQ